MDSTTPPMWETPTIRIKKQCECGSFYYHTGEFGYCWNCKIIDTTKYKIINKL